MSREWAVLALIPALALGGCLFEPRQAELPSSGSQIPYIEQTEAASVWSNCQLALNSRDVTGWDGAIADNFTYIPDGATETAYPAVDWANWGRDQEISFVTSWFANVRSVTANLLDEEINTSPGSGGHAEWDIIYFITVVDPAGATTKYRGRATLIFESPQTYWKLVEWRDESQESDPENPQVLLPTLGVVRALFSG